LVLAEGHFDPAKLSSMAKELTKKGTLLTVMITSVDLTQTQKTTTDQRQQNTLFPGNQVVQDVAR
jgi:hypothetical protein